MGGEPADRWSALGEFIREQRGSARLSLRRLSELAGISNPYLSQIERGLRRPSADILQQIAKALRISAETLYVQAGILDPPDDSPDLARQILADAHLTEEQKQALVRIYLAFRHESESGTGPPTLDRGTADHTSNGAATVGAATVGAATVGAATVGAATVGAPPNGSSDHLSAPSAGDRSDPSPEGRSGMTGQPTPRTALAAGDPTSADGGSTPPHR